MFPLVLCIEGTKGAGKTTTIQALTRALQQVGCEVDMCAAFAEANLFAQSRGFDSAKHMISASRSDNQAEIDFILATMNEAQKRSTRKARTATHPVVLLFDRGWMTVLPHLFGGRWFADEGYTAENLVLWEKILARAPPTVFLYASYEVTKLRRPTKDVLGGLDTEAQLRADIDERKALAEAHRDKVCLSFDTGREEQPPIVRRITEYVRSRLSPMGGVS